MEEEEEERGEAEVCKSTQKSPLNGLHLNSYRGAVVMLSPNMRYNLRRDEHVQERGGRES